MRRPGPKPKKNDTKICVICMAEFLPRSARTKTCSKSCANKLIIHTYREKNGYKKIQEKAPQTPRWSNVDEWFKNCCIGFMEEHGFSYREMSDYVFGKGKAASNYFAQINHRKRSPTLRTATVIAKKIGIDLGEAMYV